MPLRDRLAGCCAMLALVAAACGDGPTSPGHTGPGVHIIAAVRSDTILSSQRSLTVLVNGSDGRPARGVLVRFNALQAPVSGNLVLVWGPLTYPIRFPGDTPQQIWTYATAMTDAWGRAKVKLLLGGYAVTAKVLVTVPKLGYEDTARITITPGAPAAVRVAPRDSAVTPGRSYALRATVVDQYYNARPEPLTFRVLSGPVTVAPDGKLTGTATGRAKVLVSGGGQSDTAFVSVVPPGVLAVKAYITGNGGPDGIALTQTDGTDYRKIGRGVDNMGSPHGIAWTRDGSSLLLVRENYVYLLPPGGGEQIVLEMTGAMIGGVRASRDGRWLYFGHAATYAQRGGLYRASADGSAVERLWRNTADPTPWGIEGDRNPSPSPDGRFLAYVSERSPCGGACIRIWDLTTNQDRTYGTADFFRRGEHAAWSPIDDRIALATGTSVILVRSDGSGERVLAGNFPGVIWMDWSADGRWLVVASFYHSVTIFDTQTGEALPLTYLVTHGEAAWRP